MTTVNIGLDLPLLPKAARENGWNRKGFLWKLDGFAAPTDEFIVRQTHKPTKSDMVDRQSQISQ